MNTNQLEKFAQAARRQLHAQVAAKLDRVLTTDSAALRAQAQAVQELKDQIAARSREAVIETVAYTWFNRFCALRYMDANHYTRVGTVSPAPGHTQPEILQEAKQGVLDARFAATVDMETVTGLLSGRLPSADPQQEAYRLLLVGVCNAYHSGMPLMFERINDYTELLMPDDLLSEGSIVQAVRDALTADACADVEVIGWLYQFYISEKKDAIMARKGKVPSTDLPAVTQLFTPHWIVRYMVENALGRLWMLNHPDSRLVERMDYYIPVGSDQLSVVSEQQSVVSDQQSVVRDQQSVVSDQLSVDDCQLKTHDYPLTTDNCQLTTDNCQLKTNPESIRFCDPAAGSGHILTYAFDLLYAIYEEEGYNPVDIPRLILEQNLTGIEIDPRAGALASFALTMKAREKDRRFLRRGVQPDICIMENVTFAPDELDAYMDAVGRDLFTQHVQDWLQQFEQATTFGSLIRPLVTDTALIRERLAEAGTFQTLFLSHTHDKLRTLLRMTDALSPRYHVIVANPPYMGSSGMNRALKQFAKDHYPKSKRDLCTMFIERNLALVIPQGYVGMITMHSWMFLSSFEKLRAAILKKWTIETMAHLGPRAFDTISGEVVSTTAFTIQRRTDPDYKGQYFRLIVGNSEAEKAQMLRDNLPATDRQCSSPIYYRTSATDFEKIPGAPIAYWVSDQIRGVFEKGISVEQITISDGQTKTGNNSKYLRQHWEVNACDVGENCRWWQHPKGGPFRRWFGNVDWVIDWSPEARRHYRKDRVARILPEYLWGRSGVLWTLITSGQISFRLLEEGQIFNLAAPALFFKDEKQKLLCLGLLNTNFTALLLDLMNPTLNMNVGEVRSIPYLTDEISARYSSITAVVRKCIAIAKSDWNSFEMSWNFVTLPLLQFSSNQDTLADKYIVLRTNWQAKTEEMQLLEEENNRIFIEAYGLQDELTPDVPLSEITLTCNPHYRYGNSRLKSRNWDALCERFPETCQQLAGIAAEMAPDMPEDDRLGLEQRLLEDTMKEFVSYAVGCMFGRYSLDKPGLVLANQGETVDSYQLSVVSYQQEKGSAPGITFMPDAENVVPVLEGDWFADDVTARFREFLRVTFGEEHYDENLAFIELALNRDIQRYFRRDFYKDHLKTYHKRPIYWLFSSPGGSFQALIYMHRYQPDTASIVLNNYLREFRAKLSARKAHLEHIARSAATSKRDKTQAVKEIARIDKTLHDLQTYEDTILYPLATQQVEIDLDDGVAVNYEKLGKALAGI